jgi:alpha-tubulin suppressor-like RCC1 family protein
MVLAAPGHKFAEVSLFGGEICGIEAPDASDEGSSDGGDPNAAYCWGDDTRGGLGIGNLSLGQQSFYKTPMKVLGGLDFLHIGVGGEFACGITTDGFTYCWGDESEGQCGRGKGDYTGVPVQVFIQPSAPAQPMPLTLVSISVGGGHACGIDSAGRGICWGDNTDGQIGDGSPVTGISPDPNGIKLPTAIPGYSWIRLEAGPGSTCGVASAARTYCWGDVQRLGDGRTLSSGPPFGVSTPVEVVDESFFTLALDVYATCGMTTSGSAYGWGDNLHGSLGIGSADPSAMAIHTRPESVKVTGLLP